MKILHDQSLKPFNTFHVDANASVMVFLENRHEASTYLAEADLDPDRVMILGGGSNVLFTNDFEGVILKYEEKGIALEDEGHEQVTVSIAAGEDWDVAVEKCMAKGWYGLENLSLIPGNTGAAPVQNIGAYGTELSDRIVEVRAVEVTTGSERVFLAEECFFGYRDSIFKNKSKGQYLITSILVRLDKVFTPVLTYAVLAERLRGIPTLQLTPGMVRETVIDIRRSKLPDPQEMGNAGSFFKNPVVDTGEFSRIRNDYPCVVSFPQGDGKVKLAAGWLIEQSGLKGFRKGDAGVHEKQSLVIVNHGAASGKDILELARLVSSRVKEKFGIDLQPEVNIL